MHSADTLSVFPSALGWIAVQGGGDALKQLSFGHASPDAALRSLDPKLAASAGIGSWNPRIVNRLQAFAEGAPDAFLDLEIDLGPQTPFQRAVVAECRQIGYGKALTYGELALAAGYPRAARAVGNCMRTNRIPLVVPCHRVIASGGGAGGYSAGEGVRMKLRLLELEGLKLAGVEKSQRSVAGKRVKKPLRARNSPARPRKQPC